MRFIPLVVLFSVRFLRKLRFSDDDWFGDIDEAIVVTRS